MSGRIYFLVVALLISFAAAAPAALKDPTKELDLEGVDGAEMERVLDGLSPEARTLFEDLVAAREEARLSDNQVQARWKMLMLQAPKHVLDELFELYKRTIPSA